MKRYTINCHYDMVISVDVIADNEQQALQLAYDKAAGMSIDGAECVGHSECVTDTEALTAEELQRMEREAVTEFVRRYVGDIIADIDYYSQEREPRREFKRKLSRIAYGVRSIHWYCAISRIPSGHVLTDWLTDLYKRLADGTHERTELYNRYARLVARRKFETTYKRIDEPYYSAHVAGLSKEQQKAAFADGLRALVRTTIEQEKEGNEYVQMVTQFPATMEHNALNLFTYFRDCGFVYSWQEIYEDEQGHEQIDDYETHEAENVVAMIKAVFYNHDGESPYYDMQDIYVED